MSNLEHVDELLAELRAWLMASRENGRCSEGNPAPEFVDSHEVGLYQLVEEFTALRQELKLQTKSTRSLQEQTESAVSGLEQAIAQFRAVEPKESQAAWAAGKSLAEALADLDEALERGRAEIERGRRRIVDEAGQAFETGLEQLRRRQPWLLRRFLGSYHGQVLELFRLHAMRVRHEFFGALLEGYGLIQNRLQRALKADQIQRIGCVGKRVDPELMAVVEVVDDPSVSPGHVVEEVRRGYTWQGRVLRFAEVRAARSLESA